MYAEDITIKIVGYVCNELDTTWSKKFYIYKWKEYCYYTMLNLLWMTKLIHMYSITIIWHNISSWYQGDCQSNVHICKEEKTKNMNTTQTFWISYIFE